MIEDMNEKEFSEDEMEPMTRVRHLDIAIEGLNTTRRYLSHVPGYAEETEEIDGMLVELAHCREHEMNGDERVEAPEEVDMDRHCVERAFFADEQEEEPVYQYQIEDLWKAVSITAVVMFIMGLSLLLRTL